MGYSPCDGLGLATRTRRGRPQALLGCHHAAVVFSSEVRLQRRTVERDRPVTFRSGLVGTDRHSTGHSGTVRHTFQVLPFTGTECRTVAGDVTLCRGAFRTGWHAADSGGPIDTIRTVADMNGLEPSRELMATQQVLTSRQRNLVYSRGLTEKVAHSVPDMSAMGSAPTGRGSERMASEWRAGHVRTIRHASARSEFVRTVADSYHQGWVDDPASSGMERYGLV